MPGLNTTDFSEEAPSKDFVGSRDIGMHREDKLLQFANADVPRDVTESEIIRFDKEEQPLKAELPIDVRPVQNLRDIMEEQPLNAKDPMEVTF